MPDGESRVILTLSKSDVETKSFDKLCKIAIDTQFEKSTLLIKLTARYSPYKIFYMKRNLRCCTSR